VSGFLYETDATFSINTRRLPLSVIVGIDNTKHTFPMAFMFITITYELLSHTIKRSNNIVSLFKELENIRINA
jgi:hypothetical protein